MLIADLHIHSKYSRATSTTCDPEHLDLFARKKGIDLIGSGDFTHPAWRTELQEKLCEAEDGLYTLREPFRLTDPAAPDAYPRFVISGEISSIYKKNGRVRKVHSLILLPDLDAAERLSRKLEAIGNIHSDGRPILGLDCRDLLEITLDTSPNAIFVPAHIWTPHFSLFGAFSGFDTISECFEDLTPYIHALETGLSSDPPMNWRLSALDGYTLISNSDAHSPAKLGREANLLDIPLSYSALKNALENGPNNGFCGTIEFFPEEGKYHLDGHRACGQCLTPTDTIAAGGKCPVCGKKITVGVLHRIEQLADRAEGYRPEQAAPFESLAPLPEVLASSMGKKPTNKAVIQQYEGLLQILGPEFYILRDAPLADIGQAAGEAIQEGIRRLRAGEVTRIPGYDGVYGTVQLFSEDELARFGGQLSLFGEEKRPRLSSKRKQTFPQSETATELTPIVPKQKPAVQKTGLNEEQEAAVQASEPVIAVVAGPGTGKTKTLVARIAHLVETGVKPSEITAVTFTNKAASEMRERLERHFGEARTVRAMTIGTFHAICLAALSKSRPVRLIDPGTANELAEEVIHAAGWKGNASQLLHAVSRLKNGISPEVGAPEDALCIEYCKRLEQDGLLDYDDLLLQAITYWQSSVGRRTSHFHHLLVDEFQDINPVQYQLVQLWQTLGKSLFVIGDPDQSIYGFRGADAHCFDLLLQDHPHARLCRLTRNYRSSPQILDCALAVINENGGRPRKLTAQQPAGQPVSLLTAESELAEGIYVAKEIALLAGGIDMLGAQDANRSKDTTRDFSDIAILYRTRRQAILLERCLRQEGIPCVIAGRDNCLADPETRAAVCFFRFLTDPRDTAALRCCLKLRWKWPADLLKRYCAVWDASGVTKLTLERVRSVSSAFLNIGYLSPWLAQLEQSLPRLREKPYLLLQDWAETYHLTESEPFTRLRNLAVFHSKMPSFLESLLLGQEGDWLRSTGSDYAAGAVTLMTLHAAKGLEFPVVFLCGVNEGNLPLESSRHTSDISEERRLFFVGMTRAMEQLIILTSQKPSPFLAALPEAFLQRGPALPRKRRPIGQQLSLFDF